MSPLPVASGGLVSATFEGFTPFDVVEFHVGNGFFGNTVADARGAGERELSMTLVGGDYILLTNDQTGVVVNTAFKVTPAP